MTALETSAEIPRLTVVRERLLHEETKMKSKSNQLGQEGTLTSSIKKKQRYHYCNKFGHFKKECEEFAKVKGHSKPPQTKRKNKIGAFKVTVTAEDENSTDIESTGLMAQHALSIGVARGGDGRVLALPSLNFALPSKPFSYLIYIDYYRSSFITYLRVIGLARRWLANKV